MKVSSMKDVSKAILVLGSIVSLLSCGTPGITPAPVPISSPREQTEALVQAWVDADQALDADKYMSFYAEDAADYNMALEEFGACSREALDRGVNSSFKQGGFKVEITSFFVTPDGKPTAGEGIYYDLNNAGKQMSMPIVIIPEIEDGRIVRETDDYDRGPME